MHVTTQKRKSSSGKIHRSVLIRESYREDGKVKKRTLANLSHLPDDVVDSIRRVLQQQEYSSKTSMIDQQKAVHARETNRQLQLVTASRDEWKSRVRKQRKRIQTLMAKSNDLVESRDKWKEKFTKTKTENTKVNKDLQQVTKQIRRLKTALETCEAKIESTKQRQQRKQEQLNQCTQLLKEAKQDILEKDKALDDLKKKIRQFPKSKKK
jgi:chromosome segregation ATPase